MRSCVVCGCVLAALVAFAVLPAFVAAEQPDELQPLVHFNASVVVEPVGRMTLDGRRTENIDRPPLGLALRLDWRALDWLRLGGGVLFVSSTLSDARIPILEVFASARAGLWRDGGRVRSFTFARVELGYNTMFQAFDSEGTAGLVLGASAGTELSFGPRFGLMVEAGVRYRRNTVFRELLLPNGHVQRLSFVVFVGPTLAF